MMGNLASTSAWYILTMPLLTCMCKQAAGSALKRQVCEVQSGGDWLLRQRHRSMQTRADCSEVGMGKLSGHVTA